MTLFPESCVKKRKWRSEKYNYKQLYKNPCVSSTKVKQIMKGSLCYSESIYVHFKLSESILQEVWIYFACVYTKKVCLQLQCLGKSYVIGFSHLQCHCNVAYNIRLALLNGLMYITSISVEIYYGTVHSA